MLRSSVDMLQAFLQRQLAAAAAAAAVVVSAPGVAEVRSAPSTAAAAGVAAPAPHGNIADKRSSSSSSNSSRSNSSSSSTEQQDNVLTADEVAWHVSVSTGAAAFELLLDVVQMMSPTQGSCSCISEGQQSALAVHLALLNSKITALHMEVADRLTAACQVLQDIMRPADQDQRQQQPAQHPQMLSPAVPRGNSSHLPAEDVAEPCRRGGPASLLEVALGSDTMHH
jgi:hypothetical protein